MIEKTPPPYERVNLNGTAPLLLICDHASNFVPENFKGLGISSEHLNQHIGWDIGAAAITRLLAAQLNASAVLAGFSRLLVDPNRPPDDPSGIPSISDEIEIHGNQNLSHLEIKERNDGYFWPYHNAISSALADLRQRFEAPAVFSIHTFTPSMPSKDETDRPWHAGVLWNNDPRMAKPLIDLLGKHPDNFVIGDNQPYSGKEVYYSVDYHAGSSGLPHCAIEVRQDLVSDDKGVAYWANIIGDILTIILKAPGLHQIEHY